MSTMLVTAAVLVPGLLLVVWPELALPQLRSPAPERLRRRRERKLKLRRDEGTIAYELRNTSWALPPSAATCCSRLQAAKLRLIVAFMQSERLTQHSRVAMEFGIVPEIVAAAIKVRAFWLLASQAFWL